MSARYAAERRAATEGGEASPGVGAPPRHFSLSDLRFAAAGLAASIREEDEISAETPSLVTEGRAYLAERAAEAEIVHRVALQAAPAGFTPLRAGGAEGGYAIVGDAVVVAMQGTNDAGDVFDDLRAWPRRVWVELGGRELRGLAHRGFVEHGRAFAEVAHRRVKTATLGAQGRRRIILSAHSLGAAVVVLGARLAALGFEVDIYLFGTPAGVSRKLARQIGDLPSGAAELRNRTYLVRMPGDPVPHLAAALGWKHLEGHDMTFVDGQMLWGESAYRIARRRELAGWPWWKRWTRAMQWGRHGMMANYYRAAMAS